MSKSPTTKDDRICRVCDGGPGNDGPCLCGMHVYDPPVPQAEHDGTSPNDWSEEGFKFENISPRHSQFPRKDESNG